MVYRTLRTDTVPLLVALICGGLGVLMVLYCLFCREKNKSPFDPLPLSISAVYKGDEKKKESKKDALVPASYFKSYDSSRKEAVPFDSIQDLTSGRTSSGSKIFKNYYCMHVNDSSWEITFDKEPFAEGRFRYAFKAQYTKHATKCGQSCVVKKFKDSYIWERKGWDSTLKIYSKAQKYASEFGRGIEFTECGTGIVTAADDCPKVEVDEYTVNEDFLEGEFIKWCNNYGYVSTKARGVDSILTAFMHWSWVKSKGEEMVADIQGVKNGNRYRLTDPAMISVKRKYGATDTGIEGMAMFFLIHQCSGPCNGLPKPTMGHFVGKIPDSVLQQALAFQQLSARGTTYSHET
uniref:Alpha-type protein kinase domain-containing protein n=1 Tax=Amphimedon queenslandica TaxID=400682 RepID=A0A1X7UGV9_AMPQE